MSNMNIQQFNEQESDLPKLAAPAHHALAAAGIQRLEQLTKFSEDEVRQWHGIGPNALEQLRLAMAAKDLSFADRKINETTDTQDSLTPSQFITNQISDLGDWRGETIARLRRLLLEAAPDLTEDWKWGTAVWTCKGNVVAVGAFKDYVKLNFFRGAALQDPKGLFNAGLDAKVTRAIDIYQGDDIDESALMDLVRAAIAQNKSGGKKK